MRYSVCIYLFFKVGFLVRVLLKDAFELGRGWSAVKKPYRVVKKIVRLRVFMIIRFGKQILA